MRNNLKTLSLILLFISMHILSFAEGIGLEEARRLAKENNKASKGQEYALKSAEANKKPRSQSSYPLSKLRELMLKRRYF